MKHRSDLNQSYAAFDQTRPSFLKFESYQAALSSLKDHV